MNRTAYGFLSIYSLITITAITYIAVELRNIHVMWMAFITLLAVIPYISSKLKMSPGAFITGVTYILSVAFCIAFSAIQLENPPTSCGLILLPAILLIYGLDNA